MLWPAKKFPDLESVPVTLDGFRVRLRPPVLSDWPQWAEVRGRNQEALKPFEPHWGENALEADFFKRKLIRQHKDRSEDRGYSFLIFDKNTSALIGGVNINHVCRGASQSASLGYWLDDARQGEGLMTESLRLIIRYCFETLNLHRLNAACLPHNARSIKLLKNAGFEEEGFAKSYVQINGLWQDHKIYGLITSPEHVKISS